MTSSSCALTGKAGTNLKKKTKKKTGSKTARNFADVVFMISSKT